MTSTDTNTITASTLLALADLVRAAQRNAPVAWVIGDERVDAVAQRVMFRLDTGPLVECPAFDQITAEELLNNCWLQMLAKGDVPIARSMADLACCANKATFVIDPAPQA